MTIRFKHYEGAEARVFVMEAERALLPRSESSILNDTCNYALGAYDKELLIGAFAYDLSHRRGQRDRTLFAEGTLVANAWRGQGLGTRMWTHTIRKHYARRVEVYIVNVKAIRMLRQVEAKLPHVEIIARFGEALRRNKRYNGPVTSRYAQQWERDHHKEMNT